MPLPRERSQFDLPGAQGIVAGTGFAAAAAAEASIAKGLDGIGDVLYRDAGKLMQQKGRDAALAEPLQRGALEYEEFSRNPDGSVSRRVVRDEQGRVLPPETAPYSISFYDQAFHAAAIERYQVQVGHDARAKAAELATRFPTDPKQFSTAWASYRDAQLKGLGLPFSGPAAVVLEDIGQQHFRHVVQQRGELDFKSAVKAHAVDSARLERDAINMVMQGRSITDPEVQRTVRAYFDRVDKGAGELRYYTPAEAEEAKRVFQGQLAFSELMSRITARQRTPSVEPADAKPPVVPDWHSRLTEEGQRQLSIEVAKDPEWRIADGPGKARRVEAIAKELAKDPSLVRLDRPADVPKPPDNRAHITGRQVVEQFMRGETTVPVLERDKSGAWVSVQKKVSDFLSADERKEIAAKGTAILEYAEQTRGKIEELHQKVTGIQAMYDRLDMLMNAQRTGSVDTRRGEEDMLRMAQRGRPDLAISQFSFMRGLEEWQRRELDRRATDVSASLQNHELVKELSRFTQAGVPTILDTMSQEDKALLAKASPTIANQLLRSNLAQLQAMVRETKMSAPEQRLLEGLQAHRDRQEAALKAGKPVRADEGANLEQTDDHARAVTKIAERAVPNYVFGKDAQSDVNMIRRFSGALGVIDYRVRDYMMAAMTGGDPKQLQQAVGLGNILMDMPNIGHAKLRSLLGESGFDAFMYARNTARRGALVEGEAANIAKIAAGQNLMSLNEVAIKEYVTKAEDYFNRYLVGDRRFNVGLFSVGPHMTPIPAQMREDFRSEVKRLAGNGSPADVADQAWMTIQNRWSLTNKVFHPALAFAQPAPATEHNLFGRLLQAGPLTNMRTMWSDRAPEKLYPQIDEDGFNRVTRAQVLDQFKPGEQFKTASELKLGVNMWLTDPHQRDGKLYWRVMVTGRDGAQTMLFAKPGTSTSGYTEVSFDDEASAINTRSQMTNMREAAKEAERRITDHKMMQLQDRGKLRALGRLDWSPDTGPAVRQLRRDLERRLRNIDGSGFNPEDYGFSGRP